MKTAALFCVSLVLACSPTDERKDEDPIASVDASATDAPVDLSYACSTDHAEVTCNAGDACIANGWTGNVECMPVPSRCDWEGDFQEFCGCARGAAAGNQVCTPEETSCEMSASERRVVLYCSEPDAP